ncbi:MAG TPA: hypothetical protein DCS66_22875 [Flavobacteriaceae bacterium]|nr:hypothetical protein [Flavobacteriaceae bacterium]|tara:strand:- start:202 stop:666 length:465 start_codon:yes stop_codon:yes gene_type:complete
MVISGKAYWASIATPNTTFDPDGIWTVDVGNLDKDSIDQLKNDGLTVKNKGDDRGDFVTIKRKVRRKDGQMNRTPDLVDAKKRQMTNTMIGNGSDVNVLYSTYDWEFKGRKGTSADLKSIQVTNLIPFSSGDEESFDEVDGYASESANPSEAFA